MAKRINYLNNKDILKEIHKSKSSYCYYVDEKYSSFDFILVDPIEKMNKTKLLPVSYTHLTLPTKA